MSNVNSWTKYKATSGMANVPWRRLVLPTLLPMIIAGGLLAAFSVPDLEPQAIVLSIYLEPEDGVVAGINGPHRYFPCTPPIVSKDQANQSIDSPMESVKSESEFDDLAALDGRLKVLNASDNLTLIVSAVAKLEEGKVLLLTNSKTAIVSDKIYLQDLIRILSQSPCDQQLVILDLLWPLANSADAGDQPEEIFEAVCNTVNRLSAGNSRYILTSGHDAWAQGMVTPRESAFTHFWRLSSGTSTTDLNRDGRIDVNEVFAETKRLLEEWSLDTTTNRQIPVSLGASVNFDLVAVGATSSVKDSADPPTSIPYPDWLRQGWQQRDDYLSRYDIPADPRFLDTWQNKLMAIESRWMRGIDDLAGKAGVIATQQWATTEIAKQFSLASARRPDSLWLASKSSPCGPADSYLISATLEQFVSEINAIQSPPSDPATNKAVAAAIQQATAKIPPHHQLRLLDGMVDQVCSNGTASLQQQIATVELAKAFKVDDKFAETIILQQILANRGKIETLDHAILRLTRARSELADRTRLFAVMPRRLHELLDDCLTAEQFYWFDGFTTDDIVASQVRSALTRVEIGLSQQHCIEEAISILEQSLALLRSSHTIADYADEMQSILGKSERLGSALYDLKSYDGPIKLGDAALRFETIRYSTEQLATSLKDFITAVTVNSGTFHADSLLCVIPATLRPEVYNQLLAERQLQNHRLGRITKQQTVGRLGAGTGENQSQFSQRLSVLEQKITSADQFGERSMGVWLQHLAQTAAMTNDPSGFYQALANRLQFRDGIKHANELAVAWTESPISWSNSNATLSIKSDGANGSNGASKLSVLDTASENLRVFPSGLILQGDADRLLRFTLESDSNMQVAKVLNGVWLRWDRPGETKYIPVRFPSLQSCRTVELSMDGSFQQHGGKHRWRIWPKSSTQTFNWNIVNHDSSARTVIVNVSDRANLSLCSEPITLAPSVPAPVRFPLPKPGVTNEKSVSADQPAEALTVEICDEKSKEVLTEYHIDLDLVDVRRCLEVSNIRFELLENGGANKLDIEVQATEVADPRGHNVSLSLSNQYVNALIDIGSGNTDALLLPGNDAEHIAVRNISIEEGADVDWTVPLIIDGDAESVRLQALTPYVGGATEWQLLNKPTVLVEHPPAWIPGDTFPVKLRGLNLPDTAKIDLEYGQYVDGRFVRYFHTRLGTPQRQVIEFSAAGADATLKVDARFSEWEVAIATNSIAGISTIRVSSPIKLFDPQETSILLDDQLPTVATAYAYLNDPTKIHVDLISSPSGVQSVSMLAADKSSIPAVVDDESENKSSNNWSIQSKKALSAKEPSIITLQVISGAGKVLVTDVPVKLIAPTTTGILHGIVMEGTVPQPHLTVEIRNTTRQMYRLQTNDKGEIQATLPAGKYWASVEKTATGREAAASFTVQPGKSTNIDLQLTYKKAQPTT